ncbi:MAG: hypothetical protein QOG15_2092 [Solirubrobacteraceae bacterium]|nr:hypothetical protein [Solirubrobacteraceae bacterium]
MSAGLEALRDALGAEGGLLAETVGDAPVATDPGPDHAATAAAGRRVAAYRDEVELAVAAVREGYELHYGVPRALRIDDPDLALLAGDRLYALGLARLAAAGDLAAIGELADLISRSAQAHAEGDTGLADRAWEAGAAAIAGGARARA